MGYNSKHPVTSANCPTRAALERKPGDPGFLHQSISAKHSQAKRNAHLVNLARRTADNQQRSRSVPKQQKVK